MSEVLEFIKKEATPVEGKEGVYTLSRGSYLTFMNNHGLTKDILNKQTAANKELMVGLYQFNAEKLADRVKDAQAKGEDIDELTVKTTINTTNGPVQQVVRPRKVWANPLKPGETVTHYAVAKTTVTTHGWFDKQVLKDTEETFKKLIGE